MRLATAWLGTDHMLCTTAVWSKDLALPESVLVHWQGVGIALAWLTFSDTVFSDRVVRVHDHPPSPQDIFECRETYQEASEQRLNQGMRAPTVCNCEHLQRSYLVILPCEELL